MRIYAMPNYLLGNPTPQAGVMQNLDVGVLAYHIHVGDGIVIADWNEKGLCADVTALAEVRDVMQENESITIDLRPFLRNLTPTSSSGRTQWKRPRRMRINVERINQYGLVDDFCTCFDTEDFRSRRLSDSAKERVDPDPDKPTLNPRDGFVYLFKGTELYKIGMAVNVLLRKAAVERQCGEKLEIVHMITSTDYNQAERDLHLKYAAKRVVGEWFDLSEEDIAEFCSIKEINSEK